MKVGLFTYGMLGGGMENMLLNLAYFLKEQKLDVTIISTEVEGAWFSKIEDIGVKPYFVKGLESNSPVSHVEHIAEYINSERYDVIFINNARFAQACIPMLINNIKIIPIVHNNDQLTYDLNIHYSSYCHAYVAISPLIYKELNKRIPEEKLYLITNGINDEIVNIKVKRNFKPSTFKLLFVGRLFHEEKGVFLLPDILREAVEKYNNIFLDIIGSGSDEERLREQFDTYGLMDKVKFWGMLPIEQVYEHMCDAHILLFPSFREGFGLVLAEAQIHGCIPIATNIPDVTDFIIDNEQNGYLVTSGNVDAFTQNIILLLEDHNLLRLMSERAQQKALAKFTLKEFGLKYLDLIKKIVNTPPYSMRTNHKLDKKHTIEILALNKQPKLMEFYSSWIRKLSNNENGITRSLRDQGVKNVAIFGTLKTSLYLLYDLKKSSINVSVFLDNNIELLGKKIDGLPISSPREWLIKNGHTIDRIILSIDSEHDNEIKNALGKYFEIDNILSWKSFFG